LEYRVEARIVLPEWRLRTCFLHYYCFKTGLLNSESSNGQIDQHKFAAGHEILFRYSVEKILKRQLIKRSCKPQNGESKSITVYFTGEVKRETSVPVK